MIKYRAYDKTKKRDVAYTWLDVVSGIPYPCVPTEEIRKKRIGTQDNYVIKRWLGVDKDCVDVHVTDTVEFQIDDDAVIVEMTETTSPDAINTGGMMFPLSDGKRVGSIFEYEEEKDNA